MNPLKLKTKIAQKMGQIGANVNAGIGAVKKGKNPFSPSSYSGTAFDDPNFRSQLLNNK